MIQEKYCPGCKKFHPIAEFSLRVKDLSGSHLSHWQANCKKFQVLNMRDWRTKRRALINQVIKEIHKEIKAIKTSNGVFDYLERIEQNPKWLKCLDARRWINNL